MPELPCIDNTPCTGNIQATESSVIAAPTQSDLYRRWKLQLTSDHISLHSSHVLQAERSRQNHPPFLPHATSRIPFDGCI